MPRITLNAYSPTLFRHTKNEGPTFFWIQVGVCEHQEALIAVQFDVLLQIVEDLASMILLYLGVGSHSGLYGSFLLENIQTGFYMMFTSSFMIFCRLSLDSECPCASEENAYH